MPAAHASSAHTLPAFVEPLGGGVFAIDTGFHRPRFDAAYLLVHEGRAAFIDTGPNPGVARLLAALDALGLAREAVEHVIPTHVHLDHAGGAGLLMQALPAATLWVHPRGLRHLVDPAMLTAGARAIYGEGEMQRSYGTLVPVPAARARATTDGLTITLAGRALRFADTPGHALHHHCVWDEATRGWFTGDTGGLSYRELDGPHGPWILPSATPVQFDPDALTTSVQRLLAETPECLYLTHYGRVGAGGDVPRLGALLLHTLAALKAMALAAQAAHAGDPSARLAALEAGQRRIYLGSLHQHGCPLDDTAVLELLALDITLNAQGMAIWLDRQARAAA
jgi:glyoxylase-like metal-dependent hydrolase (beta-lactamase superfamily II)